jgi:mannan endo-1,4-beta-mannosidase
MRFVKRGTFRLALIASVAACGGSDGATTQTPAPTPTPPTGGASTAKAVTFTVAVDQDRTPISPFVYGTNQDAGVAFWTVRRNGGNRTTGYNWETNHSNAGNDYLHNSDLFALSNEGLPVSDAATPARAISFMHARSVAMGAQSIVTLQMAGHVAADANGPVSASEAAPSARWHRVVPRKPTAFSLAPDLTDGVVYMDEQVNLLVQRHGGAASPTGIRWYSLDNEPALWASTHPRIHPQPVGAVELLDRSVALASAVKSVDPKAEILGPAEYGMSGFVSLQSAPDWNGVKGSYDWYIDYFLDGMRRAEQTAGRRLLDVLDVHWYPEARGDNRIVDANATSAADASARLQAARSLWDASYREKSWIQDVLPSYLPLLPRLRRSIDQYYPGTKLAITEYDFGGKNVVSGGIAQADVLGVFGRSGVYIATMWGLSATDLYALAGFRLYRDYDGRKGTFGATSVRATSSDAAASSVYASVESSDNAVLHVILLNKEPQDSVVARVQLSGGGAYSSGEVWGFGASSPQITARPAISGISSNTFEYRVPPLTALHMVLRR